MSSFWNASQLITPKNTYNFPLPEHSETFKYIRSEGFVYEAQAIRESLLKGMYSHVFNASGKFLI